MRGHEKIIAMRLSGHSPKFVFLNDWPCNTDWFETGDHATVSTAGKAISSLDMRFLIGLTVSISSEDEKRAKALFDKVKQAGAKTVAAVHSIPGVKPRLQTGWIEVFHAQKEVSHA